MSVSVGVSVGVGVGVAVGVAVGVGVSLPTAGSCERVFHDLLPLNYIGDLLGPWTRGPFETLPARTVIGMLDLLLTPRRVIH